MRLVWKLSVIFLLAAVAQWFVASRVDILDDAQFVARTWSNAVCGRPTEAELNAAADRLFARRQSRHALGWSSNPADDRGPTVIRPPGPGNCEDDDV